MQYHMRYLCNIISLLLLHSYKGNVYRYRDIKKTKVRILKWQTKGTGIQFEVLSGGVCLTAHKYVS